MARKSKPYNLVVVAHPDDESIFFGGLLLSKPGRWKVVCATDGNADGHGSERLLQLSKAAKLLKVADLENWMFPDVYERRLSQEALQEKLRALPTPKSVYTHSIVGDYGHPHHQDVSMAVHDVFADPKVKNKIPVFSVAYNCLPDFSVKLTSAQYAVKTKIYSDCYYSETARFTHLLPAQAVEQFARVTLAEARALYDFFLTGQKPMPSQLKKYRWYLPYLDTFRATIARRPF